MRLVSGRGVVVAGGPAAGRRDGGSRWRRATSSLARPLVGGGGSQQPTPRQSRFQLRGDGVRASAGSETGDKGGSASPAPEPVESVGDAKFLERISGFLEEDLGHLFDERGIDKSIYDENVKFEDPITRYSSIDGYLFNIQMLRVLFTPEFILHKIYPVSETTLETRWTMNMTMRILPWQPKLIFTGTSQYEFNLLTEKVVRHSDTWDSIENQEYFSVEGLRDLAGQVANFEQTPDLESPQYVTLKRLADYQIRKYDSFLVCQTGTSSSDATTGDGFNDLAGFIFGANERRETMNMTTPVYTKRGEAGGAGNTKMQFVIENSKYKTPSEVPSPTDSSKDIEVLEEEGALVAVASVSGLPLEADVTRAEQALRLALERDGLDCEEGFELARYNEPFVLPPFRRNEVLIRLKSFAM